VDPLLVPWDAVPGDDVDSPTPPSVACELAGEKREVGFRLLEPCGREGSPYVDPVLVLWAVSLCVSREFVGGKRTVRFRLSDPCGRESSLYLDTLLLLLRDSACDADTPSVAREFGGGKREVTVRPFDDESLRERTCLWL